VGVEVEACSKTLPLMVMVLVTTRSEGELVVLNDVVLGGVDVIDGAPDVSLVEDVVVLVSGGVALDVEGLGGVEDEVELGGVVVLDDVVLGVDLLDVESAIPDITTEFCRLTFSSAPMTAIARRKAERRKSEEANEHRILGTGGSEPERARCGRLFRSGLGRHRDERGKEENSPRRICMQ